MMPKEQKAERMAKTKNISIGNLKHGQRRRNNITKEYIAWGHMKQRCLNATHPAYKNYGGRGITVCERWLLFENFFADMGKALAENLSLDRIDNNGNYEPGNCKWSTAKEQVANRRTQGIINLSDASKKMGGNRMLILSRLRRGWSLEQAINTPVLKEWNAWNIKKSRDAMKNKCPENNNL